MKRFLIGIFAALLSVAASGTTFTPIQLLNPVGSVAGQVIVSSGPTTVAAWGGIGVNGITAIAANTVIANATGSSASPTAFAMPSCTGSANALGYTSGTGIICNGSINAATLGGATFASPGSIGATTAGAGAFTSLSASGTVTGAGFSNYLLTPPPIGSTTPNAGRFTTVIATTSYTLTNLVSSVTAPTVSSGFGTSPTISNNNGTAAFLLHIGTGGTASTGVLTMPTASNGWMCDAADISSQSSTVFITKVSAEGPTSVTLTQYNTSGAAAAWGSGDFVVVKCSAF
jgi:hypothetical protein